MDIDLRLGNCLDVMKEMADNSVDSIVCDPPYGLHFMLSKWDYDVPSVEIWRECLRVLKHGGHLLAFSGTRTYHRVVVNIEDAGFEIRDQIQWIYSSGFPKSHNVGKNIDKAAGAKREVIGENSNVAGRTTKGNTETDYGGFTKNNAAITTPTTPEAKQWDGWGTALKPANEPICLARKPLIGTVVENVLKHGTGAMNIDASRIATDERMAFSEAAPFTDAAGQQGRTWNPSSTTGIEREQSPLGRWPANVIHDGSEEVVQHFPESSGGHWAKAKITGYGRNYGGTQDYAGVGPKDQEKGSAARFFYCAKANQKERNAGLETSQMMSEVEGASLNRDNDNPNTEGRKANPIDCITQNKSKQTKGNFHPTVKPVDLMRYLCRLVTPPEGIVLDPFMGSGTTGIAACLEGFNFVGIELDEEYLGIARYRIAHWGDYEITETQTLIPQKKITEWI
jgi:site-specific DNA-methyltransferase (adenine-specific)